jgi:hypothetical protein
VNKWLSEEKAYDFIGGPMDGMRYVLPGGAGMYPTIKVAIPEEFDFSHPSSYIVPKKEALYKRLEFVWPDSSSPMYVVYVWEALHEWEAFAKAKSLYLERYTPDEGLWMTEPEPEFIPGKNCLF